MQTLTIRKRGRRALGKRRA